MIKAKPQISKSHQSKKDPKKTDIPLMTREQKESAVSIALEMMERRKVFWLCTALAMGVSLEIGLLYTLDPKELQQYIPEFKRPENAKKGVAWWSVSERGRNQRIEYLKGLLKELEA